MTQAEFYEAQRIAQDKVNRITRTVRREIAYVYINAADEIAKEIKTLKTTGKGDSLTAASKAALEKSLRATGMQIASDTESIVVDTIDKSIDITNKPHLKYLFDAISLSGTKKINMSTINGLYTQINTDLIELTYNRVWDDGYTFSNRIWGFPGTKSQPYLPGLGEYWKNNVNDLVLTGLAQGRDVIKIAEDLSFYAVHGKGGLVKRYGDLVRGSGVFRRRIPDTVDWRAMRLARSELYISLQESAKLQGKFNPAVLKYNWNLTGGVSHGECPCPGYAADSPYAEGDVPDFPHPNCLCYITHRIMSRDKFVDDLVSWSNGGKVPYLETWYQDVYKAA